MTAPHRARDRSTEGRVLTRVAMVTARRRPEGGGIDPRVAEVARRLVDAGVDVEVLTTDRSRDLPRAGGYAVRRFRSFPRGRVRSISPGLLLAVMRTRADLVHLQGHTLTAPLVMLAAVLGRVPFVLTFHTGGSPSRLGSLARGLWFRLLAPLLRRAHALVGVSGFEVDQFQEIIGAEPRVRLIRDGIWRTTRHEAVAPDPDLVVSLGRFGRRHGHHRVVEALPHLLRIRPGARVMVLGVGPGEADLLALADRLGVADRVTVRALPPDRLATARSLAAAGVVALLSGCETHPASVMEALALGRPVLVARAAGLTELADRGWAVGVAVTATPTQVAAALEAQLSTPVAPRRAELPTWEDSASALADLYVDLLARDLHPDGAGAA